MTSHAVLPVLLSRLDADVSALVEEANHGQPAWWTQSAWSFGLPTWSRSGRPFRGLAALLLWRAATKQNVPIAWQEARSPQDPGLVVVPVRSKRGWAPLAVVPAPRLAALPFSVPKWDDALIDRALAALRIADRPRLSEVAEHVRELLAAFVQSLRRHPSARFRCDKRWTIASLSLAARLAASAADALFASQVGKVFLEEQVWERGDVAALFPWEAQVPSTPPEVGDRRLKPAGARVLLMGRRAGQLPMRQGARLRLDRVWERGEVLEGYARITGILEALRLPISGDLALDARTCGLSLAWRMHRLEPFPVADMPGVAGAWDGLARRIKRKSWAHHLDRLFFSDLRYDRRWHADRLLPRARKIERSNQNLGALRLSQFGLVRLLDAMGPKRPSAPPETADLLATIRQAPDRSYRRYAIFKSDGTKRWLDVPNAALADAQRKMVEALRPGAPFAGVATAFEPGRSPALHARMHEGACAAIVMDIADFFGSIRPRHLRWAFQPRKPRAAGAGARASSQGTGQTTRKGRTRSAAKLLVKGGGKAQREEIIALLFAGGEGRYWLPQGAPSSPWAANLAAHPMDRRIRAWAREWGAVRYSRYADDLVLSLHPAQGSESPPDDTTVQRFLAEAEHALRAAIESRGFRVKEEKTRRWRREARTPLTLCGIEVPRGEGAPCRLPRNQHLRARAALHRVRCGAHLDHGLLAWAWSVTGHPGWLAWTNHKLTRLAIELAGPVLSEAFMSGWADSVDVEQNSETGEEVEEEA